MNIVERTSLEKAEAYARHVECKKIIVNTRADGRSSCFIKKPGYEEMGALKNCYENGNAVFV